VAIGYNYHAQTQDVITLKNLKSTSHNHKRCMKFTT
jgi:hypothetical protein